MVSTILTLKVYLKSRPNRYLEQIYSVIAHDLRVLLEELEFFAQWLIRDGEDLVYPWVNYTSREMIDQYVFNYTFAAGEIIELSGQTAFRTYRIVEEATIVWFFLFWI